MILARLRSALVLVAAVVAVPSAVPSAQAGGPALQWLSAPGAGAHLTVRDLRRPVLRISAAAAEPRARVTISLLGRSPVRLSVRRGNPAVAVLTLPGPQPFGARTLGVTVVARTTGRHPVALTRTFVLVLRPTTISLRGPGQRSRWAFVRRATIARGAPSRRARAVAAVPRTTPDTAPNLVRVDAEARDPSGTRWVLAELTVLPNGRTGWIPRRDLSVYHVVETRLVVDRAQLALTLYRAGRQVFHAAVGIGTRGAPTPRGVFYVRERLTRFGDPFYGPIAFGTSARSPTLTDWPGGGIVGIHGTNRPELLPGRVSHGCIRLRNADIVRLARLLPLGTPVEIR
ncbi:MAG TPA: L,D-transpeptidase [Gaiellaceae bacterium]|jgi:lipoprotein-anchoring transpeptidase ErfK/SrfK